MKTRNAFLPNFSQTILTLACPASSAVVGGMTANSGVTTPKLCEGWPKLVDLQRAQAG